MGKHALSKHAWPFGLNWVNNQQFPYVSAQILRKRILWNGKGFVTGLDLRQPSKNLVKNRDKKHDVTCGIIHCNLKALIRDW